jgi:GntR family carbon starvation induced transcriptional regulator
MTSKKEVDTDETRSTRATSIYAALRESIIRAEIAPGTKINIREICERFGAGLSPVREALSKLSTEGFVTHSDQRGFSVASLDLGGLEQLVRARCWVNETGLRQSIARGDAAWEDGLALAFNRMNRIQRLNDEPYARTPEWAQAHMAFHRALISGSGSSWITRFCDELFEAAERYRFAARHTERARTDVASEHEGIFMAAIRGDADEAVRLLNAHLETTANLVRTALPAANADRVDISPGKKKRREA